MNDIKVSVVIPTYNRKELLKYTLESLKVQTLSLDQFEVIVVDDGGSDGSDHIVSQFSDSINIKYFWQEDLGFRAGKARNIGTAIATGKYIVYLDSGVLLGRDSLAEHMRIHSQNVEPTVVIGYVYGFEVGNSVSKEIEKIVDCFEVDRTICELHKLCAFDIREKQYDQIGDDISTWPAPFDILWTCHVSASRDELLRAGLFDEGFNTWGGEDVDLGVRLFLNKNRFQLARNARSFHWPHANDMNEKKSKSYSAGLKIHKKYGLWSTSYYAKESDDEKFSLNKEILVGNWSPKHL